MTDVYLVRHAIAEKRDAHRWPDDSQRPLTDEGVARFRRAVRGLRELVPTVDQVFSSPYVRAWATAEILARDAGWPPPEQADALAAVRPADDPLELLRGHGKGDALALVGHEPQLSSLASLLLTASADGLDVELKKGGVMALAYEGGSARLRWTVTPRILRAVRA